ncbi:hypothetical protein C8Q75DRAFT_744936 [Abortiporus biennis]|nr:hypothetical protein C8Q75DRAFT_744936 [Abortiporus biennis]
MDHKLNIVSGFADEEESTAGLPRLHLPPEIWLHICESFDLEKSLLRNLSLCNRTLRSLAQPFVFRKVELSSYSTRDPCAFSRLGFSHMTYPQTPSYFASLMERLEFLCSPRIARAIQSIQFQSRFSSAVLHSELTINCQTLADTLFRHITSFHNLTSIAAEGFRFTTDHLLQTFQLPKLESFRFSGVTEITQRINSSYSCPKLRELYIRLWNSEDYPWWMCFIGQDTTERLSFFRFNDSSTRILKTISSSPPLLRLKSLTLGSMATRPLDIVEVLSNCPSLEEFNIGSQADPSHSERYTRELENILSKDIAPNLLSISGPLYVMLPLLQHRTIQRFRPGLHNLVDRDDSSFVLDRLRDNAPHLRSLSLSFMRHDLTQYFSILSHCREMESFRVICLRHVSTVEEVCKGLYHADIPMTLKSLELITATRPEDKISSPSPLVEKRLNEEFPNLSSVWITTPEFQLKWNRVA